MTDYERAILSHYNLATPFPVEWPLEKDQSDASDGDDDSPPKAQTKAKDYSRRKSRYSGLGRVGGAKPKVKADSNGDGPEALVQRDESDPLGSSESVVRLLRRRGLPVEDDSQLRASFIPPWQS